MNSMRSYHANATSCNQNKCKALVNASSPTEVYRHTNYLTHNNKSFAPFEAASLSSHAIFVASRFREVENSRVESEAVRSRHETTTESEAMVSSYMGSRRIIATGYGSAPQVLYVSGHCPSLLNAVTAYSTAHYDEISALNYDIVTSSSLEMQAQGSVAVYAPRARKQVTQLDLIRHRLYYLTHTRKWLCSCLHQFSMVHPSAVRRRVCTWQIGQYWFCMSGSCQTSLNTTSRCRGAG
jgi:hypothetical protein